jgi:hypothetical protein
LVTRWVRVLRLSKSSDIIVHKEVNCQAGPEGTETYPQELHPSVCLLMGESEAQIPDLPKDMIFTASSPKHGGKLLG